MTNLTEKWKAGELEWHKSYYCKNDKNKIIIATLLDGNILSSNDSEGNLLYGYWEVLVLVPSYEEVQDMKEYLDYSIKNRNQLTEQINFWMDKTDEINKKNARLKELLKECVFIIGYADTISNNEENKKTIYEIFTKIKEILK